VGSRFDRFRMSGWMRLGWLALATVVLVSAASASIGRASSGSETPVVVIERGGYLWALAIDGSRAKRLTRVPGVSPVPGWGLAISPDRSLIAFTGRHGGLSLMRFDGSRRTMLTRGGGESPAWSPDGKTIYFVRTKLNRFGASCGSLFAVPAAGGRVRRITDSTRSGHSHIEPAVAPTGDRIAFTDWDKCEGGTASPRLAIVDRQGRPTRDLARLTHNGYFPNPEHSAPAWSPDGSRLAYRHGSDLAVVNRDGSRERRIRAKGDVLHIGEIPAWSPDGHWIAYVRHVGGGYDPQRQNLLIVHPDGTGSRRLTTGPDGDFIVVGWLESVPR
jgi:Tol biopolymer transport system component